MKGRGREVRGWIEDNVNGAGVSTPSNHLTMMMTAVVAAAAMAAPASLFSGLYTVMAMTLPMTMQVCLPPLST